MGSNHTVESVVRLVLPLPPHQKTKRGDPWPARLETPAAVGEFRTLHLRPRRPVLNLLMSTTRKDLSRRARIAAFVWHRICGLIGQHEAVFAVSSSAIAAGALASPSWTTSISEPTTQDLFSAIRPTAPTRTPRPLELTKPVEIRPQITIARVTQIPIEFGMMTGLRVINAKKTLSKHRCLLDCEFTDRVVR